MHGATEGATPVRWETSTYFIQPVVGDWVDVVHSETGERKRMTGLQLATLPGRRRPVGRDLVSAVWEHGKTLEQA